MGHVTGPHVHRAFRVTGLVQGVGFRWFTRNAALRLGLTGWVANDPDGAVSGEVFGGASQVEEFERALRQGPPGARVAELHIDDVAGGTAGSTFDIRR